MLCHYPKSRLCSPVLAHVFVCLFIIVKGIYRADDLELKSSGCTCMFSVCVCTHAHVWVLLLSIAVGRAWPVLLVWDNCMFLWSLWSILCLDVARVSMWQDPHLGALATLSKSVPLLPYSYRSVCA